MSILNLGKVRPVLLGAYNEATEYKFLNGVSYNGSYYFYINETASTGNLPTDTEYWAIAAQKGDKGDLGASIVTAAFVDDDMVFTLDDDTTVTLVGAKTVLKGDKGDMGTIYTPAISEDGVLSFTNNGGLDNPTPVDLTGPQGDLGASIDSAAFSGNDIVFTRDDDTTVTLPNAKIALKGDKGV